MKPAKNNGLGISQTVASVADDADTWQSVHSRLAGLTIRVRTIDCMLADIDAHIQALRRERIQLGLVRQDLTGKEAR